MSDIITELCNEAARLQEDVLWSEKAHFAMATVWRRAHYWLGIPSALLAAFAGVSALKLSPELAAVLAALSVLLTSLLTFLQPEKRATEHHQTGIAYSDLRGKLRRLRLIEALDATKTEELKQELSEYAATKTEIMKAHRTLSEWLTVWQKSVKGKEHEYEIDAEAKGSRPAGESDAANANHAQ
jgi:hypothetical protein